MADTERSDRDALIDNLIDDKNYFVTNATTETKEQMLKDNISKMVKQLVEDLNAEFEDVHFEYDWDYNHSSNTSENHELTREKYDYDYSDDRNDHNFGYNDDPDDYQLYDSELKDVMFTLRYTWERTCNLGCRHKTKRFHIYDLPKLLNILSLRRLFVPTKEIVREYIPDFFYDVREIEMLGCPLTPLCFTEKPVQVLQT